MADPDHLPHMDGLDVCSVYCYRAGLSAIALGFAVTAWLGLSAAPVEPAFGWLLVAAGAALLYGYLAFAKWRMPLYFDIGDKSQYQL